MAGASNVADLIKSAASAAASTGGEAAAGAILNLVFGIKDESAQLDSILMSLQGIDKKLGQVELQVRNIGLAIDRLDSEIKRDLQQIQIDISQEQLDDAISAINTHFGDTPEVGLQSYSGVASKRDAPEKSEIDEFVRGTLQSWDIPKQAREISSALLGGLGSSKGLLEGWTNLFILKLGMEGNTQTAFEYYCILEVYFEQYLAIQAKALCILVNAYNYSEARESRDTTRRDQSPNAIKYVNTIFAPALRSQIDKFLYCAERLVFSQWDFRKMWRSDSLALPLPECSSDILGRAEAVASEYLASIGDRNPSGGLCARVITRPSLVVGERGPNLTPAGLGPSTGQVERNHVFRTVDGAWNAQSNRPAELAPYAKSSIVVVRYYWDWSGEGTPQLGESFAPWRPEYYERTTHRKLSLQGPDSLVIATAIDTSQVYFDPLAAFAGFTAITSPGQLLVAPQRESSGTDLGVVDFKVTHPEGLPTSIHANIRLWIGLCVWYLPAQMTLFKYTADETQPIPLGLSMKGRIRYKTLSPRDAPAWLFPVPDAIASISTIIPPRAGESGPDSCLIDTRVMSPALTTPREQNGVNPGVNEFIQSSSEFVVERRFAIEKASDYGIGFEFHAETAPDYDELPYLTVIPQIEIVLEIDSIRFSWDQPGIESL